MRQTESLSYKEKNQAFLLEYRKQTGVQELPGGILYRILAQGSGLKPTLQNTVTVHYRGKLINGKLFDATPQGHPASFKLNGLITGWKTALQAMPVGARWEIVIPYQIGYGTRPCGVIKGYSTLVFDIQLLAIE